MIKHFPKLSKKKKPIVPKFYLDNGCICKSLKEVDNHFYICEYENQSFLPSRFIYPGDEIINTLVEDYCVRLYDVFQNKIFTDESEYYKYFDFLPQGITRAGLDSDFDLPKENFGNYFEDKLGNTLLSFMDSRPEYLDEIFNVLDARKYKYAYLADCQSLVNSLQELILTSHSNFISFYKQLGDFSVNHDFSDDVYYAITTEGRMIFGTLTSLIISLYSCFDILTKISFELENIPVLEDHYERIQSRNILFGGASRIKNINKENTIFSKTREIAIIENLRNELVHNAVWEMNPKIFIHKNNRQLMKKVIYLPDFNEDGHLITYKNRKRFFSQQTELNVELPGIYFSVLNAIGTTLQRLLLLDDSITPLSL